MHRLSLRTNRLKFKTSEKLAIILKIIYGILYLNQIKTVLKIEALSYEFHFEGYEISALQLKGITKSRTSMENFQRNHYIH